MSAPLVLLAHPGTQHSGEIASQLALNGMLSEYWTGFALRDEAPTTAMLRGVLPSGRWAKLGRRLVRNVPSRCLRTRPLLEFGALWRLHGGAPAQEVFRSRNARFQELIPNESLKRATVIAGYDTSSWILAARARDLGRAFVLERTIGHGASRRKVFDEIAGRHPDWREELGAVDGFREIEDKEHELATHIVVESSFVKTTLVENGVNAGRVSVIPLGVDLDLFRPAPTRREEGPVRFLFVGAIQARKGIPLLFEAWKSLGTKNAELRLAGGGTPSALALIPKIPGISYLGQCPHPRLPALMRECDALVFPSFFEGFGLVLLEAMACGLPVITTPATAGPDLITDGVEGFVVPCGDPTALAARMAWCCENRAALSVMGRAARHRAEAFPWTVCGTRWCDRLRNLP